MPLDMSFLDVWVSPWSEETLDGDVRRFPSSMHRPPKPNLHSEESEKVWLRPNQIACRMHG